MEISEQNVHPALFRFDSLVDSWRHESESLINPKRPISLMTKTKEFVAGPFGICVFLWFVCFCTHNLVSFPDMTSSVKNSLFWEFSHCCTRWNFKKSLPVFDRKSRILTNVHHLTIIWCHSHGCLDADLASDFVPISHFFRPDVVTIYYLLQFTSLMWFHWMTTFTMHSMVTESRTNWNTKWWLFLQTVSPMKPTFLPTTVPTIQ